VKSLVSERRRRTIMRDQYAILGALLAHRWLTLDGLVKELGRPARVLRPRLRALEHTHVVARDAVRGYRLATDAERLAAEHTGWDGSTPLDGA